MLLLAAAAPFGKAPAMAAGECIPALATIRAMWLFIDAFDEPRAGEGPNPIFASAAFAFMFDMRPELAEEAGR